VWPRDEAQYPTDLKPVRGNCPAFVPTREQMAALGWKWTPPENPVRGHITHVNRLLQTQNLWKDFPEYAARAGVECLVFMNDWGDIGHGLSDKGDYTKVPPHLPHFIGRLHRYGIKAMAWYSPGGAYIGKKRGDPPSRPLERQDPLVRQHLEDWFLEGSIYWHDSYIHASPFSGFADWFVKKVDHDLTVLPILDGIAMDEPLGNTLTMWDAERGQTGFARKVEVLQAVRDVVKRHGRDKLVIANEGLVPPPAHELFDAQTLEARVGWMIELTGGRFAGHKHGGKYHDWSYIYNYYREQLWRWNSPIGWAHLAWYVAAKPRAHWHETADLLRAGVMGDDITRWQPEPDLFQMEIRGPDGTWWVLLNDGAPREHTIAPRKPLRPGRYRRFVWVDGPKGPRRVVEAPNETDIAASVSINVGEVPEKGIVTVGWMPSAEWKRTQQVLADAAQAVARASTGKTALRARLEGAEFVAELGFLTRARKLASQLIE